MSSPEHVNITCIPHQSSLYLQSPPDSKKQKLNRDPKARRSSRYLCLVLRLLYFFSLRFHHHCVHYRHRKQRGEVSLTVGSSETLRDVKVQVKQIFFFFLIIFPGGWVPGSIFAGYVPLSSKNPYPLYSILWPIIDPILVGKGEKKRKWERGRQIGLTFPTNYVKNIFGILSGGRYLAQTDIRWLPPPPLPQRFKTLCLLRMLIADETTLVMVLRHLIEAL